MFWFNIVEDVFITQSHADILANVSNNMPQHEPVKFQPWDQSVINELLALPRIGDNDGFKGWSDVTIPRLLEDKYYTSGRTGADAMVAFWVDISNGLMPDICNEFEIPEQLGLVHSMSTLAKHFMATGKMYMRKP